MTPDEINSRLSSIKRAVRQYLDGIDQTAGVFPLGALHLAASLIDVLARLTSDGKDDLKRYGRFVRDYFPSEYADGALPRHLYTDLRCVGLHNLSVGRKLTLMDGQMDLSAHLQVVDDRTIVRMEEFLRDLHSAVDGWETRLQADEALRAQVVDRERRNPVGGSITVQLGRDPCCRPITQPLARSNSSRRTTLCASGASWGRR